MCGFFWRRKEEKKEQSSAPSTVGIPEKLRIDRSFNPEDIAKAKSEMRINSVEKEVLGETLTRLYEATAEGKITEEERDRLIEKYKEQLSRLDSTLENNQKRITLYELEETRSELIKMFQEKFTEVNTKIDDFRKKLGFTSKHTSEFRFAAPATREPKPSAPPEKPAVVSAPRRSKADEELDKLRQELQKELEKLEQIELES